MMKLDDDPEPLDGKYLGSLTADFVLVADQLKEACYQVAARKISQHPIVVMCLEPQSLGATILKRGAMEGQLWFYALTIAEELVQRGLIADIEAFASTYKDYNEFCCLLVVDTKFTNFVYIPYPED